MTDRHFIGGRAANYDLVSVFRTAEDDTYDWIQIDVRDFFSANTFSVTGVEITWAEGLEDNSAFLQVQNDPDWNMFCLGSKLLSLPSLPCQVNKYFYA